MNEQQAQQISPAQIFANLPGYLIGTLSGLVLGILTDLTLTSTFITSAAVSLATNIYWGIALFFLIQALLRIVNAVTGAIVAGAKIQGQGQIQAMQLLATVLSPPQEVSDGPAKNPPTEA